MYDGHGPGSPHIPAWLIVDQRYRDTYVFSQASPSAQAAAPRANGTHRRR